jgi:hypothetical protein
MYIGRAAFLSPPRTMIGRPSAFSPSSLGGSLLACWDAERSDLITRDGGGLVSSWRDTVGGYDTVQATGTAQPIWSATSFNGRPGIAFDGTDDCLSAAVPASFPLGAVGSEIWAVVDQLSLDADVNNRSLFGYGGGVNSTARRVLRSRLSTVSRFQSLVGDGTTTVFVANLTASGNGRHVVRLQVASSASQTDVDAVAGASAAAVPATVATRLRIGAGTGTSPLEFGQMIASAMLVTASLTAEQATALRTYLAGRV